MTRGLVILTEIGRWLEKKSFLKSSPNFTLRHQENNNLIIYYTLENEAVS